MGVRNLLHKPLHFEYALAFYGVWKLLKLYALCRQLRLVKKELAGEKKVVTTLARKDDENYKKTMSFLKPYLSSSAYHKTLEYNYNTLWWRFVSILVNTAANLAFFFYGGHAKFWHFAGKLYTHKCYYSHVFVYLLLRVGSAMLLRFPFHYLFGYCLKRKHGLATKSLVWTFVHYWGSVLFNVLLFTLFASGFTYLLSMNKADFHLNAFFFLVMLVLVYVWAVPLFYNLFHSAGHLEDLELRKEVDAMGKKLGLSSRNVRVVPDERLSDLLSLVFGFGRNTVVYVSESEVAAGRPTFLAQLAHAFGHVKYHHFLKFALLYFLKLVVLVFVFYPFRMYTPLYKSLGVHPVSSQFVRFDVFLFVAGPFVYLFYVFKKLYGHYVEFKADRYAVKMGYGDELLNFLVSFYRERKHYFNLDPFYGLFYWELPSLFERVYSVFEASVAPKAAN